MTHTTDTNQASEDDKAMQHICQQTGEHYYASESIPGGLIHWIRICMTCGHKDYEDLNEQVKTLIRNEKLKLLAEIKGRVVGEDYDIPAEMEKVGRDFQKLDAIAKTGGLLNKFKADLRTKLNKLEAEL